MLNPILFLDAKDAVVIWLLAHAAVDLVLVCAAGALWASAHMGWWR